MLMMTLAMIIRTFRATPTMPQMRPAFVRPRPDGSMMPASISPRSVLPMTHAMIPVIMQQTMPRMPRVRITPPRCGLSIGA